MKKLQERFFLILPILAVGLFFLFQNNSDKPDQQTLSLKQEVMEVGVYDSLFMVGMEPIPDFTMLSPDFIEFYDRFNADAVFQQKHLYFPLKGVCFSSCDSTALWDDATWQFLSWDFRNLMEDPRYSNVLAQSRDKVFFKCVFKNLGILYELGFVKKNGKWKLVYCVLNAC